MDFFARTFFRHQIVLPTLTRRKEKKIKRDRETNDRDKKEQKK